MRPALDSRSRRLRCGAALYSLVAANALLVGLLGLSALTVTRVQRQSTVREDDSIVAKANAAAAMELAALELATDPDWRSTRQQGVASAPMTLGKGSLSWRYEDPTDASLADDPSDPVDVVGVGRSGEAVWSHGLRYTAQRRAALDHAIHTGGVLRIPTGKTLSVVGASASSNAELNLGGLLNGNAVCLTRSGSGSHTGFVTVGAAAKRLPSSSVINLYRAMATELPRSGDLLNDVLAPGVNTYGGGLNANGIYYINAGLTQIVVRGTRIQGTLVIQGNCRIEDSALLSNHRPEHPALIVSGSLTVSLNSAIKSLSEAEWGTNFNPAGAPYEGGADSDTQDIYPNEIRGLVHVGDDLTLAATARIRGAALVADEALCNGSIRIEHDASLSTAPPLHYDLVDYDMRPQLRGVMRRMAP